MAKWFDDNAPDLSPTGADSGTVTGGTFAPPTSPAPPVVAPAVKPPMFTGTLPPANPNAPAFSSKTPMKPDYVNYADPVQQAVWQAFASKNVSPRDQQDFQYWVDKINQTGGFGNADNKTYWLDRMAQAQGGVGDYQTQPEAGDKGPFSYPDWNQTFDYQPFDAPTGVTEQNDPGVTARLQMGTDALERSAASKGTLLTGGTLKDLNSYAQDFASNEFGNVYNRAANTYNTQRSNALQNYMQKYNQYLQGYQQAANSFGINYDVAENASNQMFNRQFSLAQLGFQAANAQQNAGGNISNLYGNAGNANAAGSIAQGNIYGNLFGNLGNYGTSLYALSQYGNGQRNVNPNVNNGYIQ